MSIHAKTELPSIRLMGERMKAARTDMFMANRASVDNAGDPLPACGTDHTFGQNQGLPVSVAHVRRRGRYEGWVGRIGVH